MNTARSVTRLLPAILAAALCALPAITCAQAPKKEKFPVEGLDDLKLDPSVPRWLKPIYREPDPAKQTAMFEAAIAEEPNSAERHRRFASHLWHRIDDADRAEKHYKRATELAPTSSKILGSYAHFLTFGREQYEKAETYHKRIIELDPKSADAHSDYADLLTDGLHRHDDAEKHYKRALELDPEHDITHDCYAIFLTQVRKNYEAAAKHHQLAIKGDPEDEDYAINYAQTLCALKRWDEAAAEVNRSIKLSAIFLENGDEESIFIRWLLARRAGVDGTQALGRIKAILQDEYEGYEWNFAPVLVAIRPELPEAERGLADKLAAAINDEKKVPELETEPIWKQTKPISQRTPWPDEPPKDLKASPQPKKP